jgi:hypothetical protein
MQTKQQKRSKSKLKNKYYRERKKERVSMINHTQFVGFGIFIYHHVHEDLEHLEDRYHS